VVTRTKTYVPFESVSALHTKEVASTSAPSSILPSTSAAAAAAASSVSEGWSSRLERQASIQSLELEPPALSSVLSPESPLAPANVVRDDITLSVSSSASIEVLSRKPVSIEVPHSMLLPPLNESLLLNDRKDNNTVHTSPLVSVLIETPEREPTALSLESATASAIASAGLTTVPLQQQQHQQD